MVIRLLTAPSIWKREREREEREGGNSCFLSPFTGNGTGGREREREGGYLLHVLTPMMAQAWPGMAWKVTSG
jgi:hypothetical protein